MEEAAKITGIHHVTAIAGDPQSNIDFYTGLLGLRLVKLTVNFDDPTAYHLYYGDEVGHPGTILTFFHWPTAHQGRIGTGQATTVSFSIPKDAPEFWKHRLRSHQVAFHDSASPFGDQVLTFTDPDGLPLELVANKEAEDRKAWERGPVPIEYALRGFYGVTLSETGFKPTGSVLTMMGFRHIDGHSNSVRFEARSGAPGSFVDVISSPSGPRGVVNVGTIHHVAWRTPNVEQQKSWRSRLLETGLNVTPIIDRKYFHSIYFREPGGVLFEIATDPPGFTVDEQVEALGSRLQLPPWLEPLRQNIEQTLPPIRLPTIAKLPSE